MVPKLPSLEKDEKDKDKDKQRKHKKKDKTRDKEASGGGGSGSTGGSKDHSSSSKEEKEKKRKEKSSSSKNDKQPTESVPQKQLKLTPPVEEEPAVIQHSESSNSSFPEIPKITTPKEKSASPAAPPPPPPQKKERKSKSSVTPTPTTANKDSTDSKIKRRRESIAVSSFVEPPAKQTKKDDKVLKNGHDKSPGDESNVFRPPAPATAPPHITTTTTVPHVVPPDYMAELQELHHKIMTLQDNKELQQVVELIAETGNYEITSRTFDFDLCKLDRNTVQRLQDFFAASAAS